MPKKKHCKEHAVYPDRQRENHPNWKGGRWIRKDRGYINLTRGNGKHILEHRFIWEEHNQRKLPQGWIVHHLNGIRSDNRIENLVAMPRKQHPNGTFIKILQQRIRELEQLRLPF